MISKLVAVGALGLLLLAYSPSRAGADEPTFASPESRAAHSSARLLSGGGARAGIYHAGVQIELEPKTITYWRQPGDAGTPPIFDFSQSENLADAEVLYPAPARIVEAGVEVAGYERSVIFPLRVKPRDAQKPVKLRLALGYAACTTICLPAKAQLSLTLPMLGISPFASEIEAAEALVPKQIGEAEARKLFALTRRGQNETDSWSLRYLGPDPVLDIFVEAPEPFFLETARAAKDAFELRLVSSCCSHADNSGRPLTARMTAITGAGAVEAPLRLD